MIIYKEFGFEASHWLPYFPFGHKCQRPHGHHYTVVVRLAGDVGPNGMVIDHATIVEAWEPVFDVLDHSCLNEIKGLENPTTSVLARWIWDKMLISLPLLYEIEVRDTPKSGVIYDGGR